MDEQSVMKRRIQRMSPATLEKELAFAEAFGSDIYPPYSLWWLSMLREEQVKRTA